MGLDYQKLAQIKTLIDKKFGRKIADVFDELKQQRDRIQISYFPFVTFFCKMK